jgi:hypothetical protein
MKSSLSKEFWRPRSIQTTQRYIDGDTDAQRKLVAMI